MTVFDLNRRQLNELKETYFDTLTPSDPQYNEWLTPQDIPDDVIFLHYSREYFREDDFMQW